jgi:hypothetical protein
MSRRKTSSTDYHADNALTWSFAGLLIIALVAGILGQFMS